MFATGTDQGSGMSEPPARPSDQHEAETYEIRLRGHLDRRWADSLGVPLLTHDSDGTTTLGGIAADQAALHGPLQRVRDLGLTLISVTRTGFEPTTTSTLTPTKPGNPK